VPAGLTLVVGSGGLQCVAAIGLLRVLAEAGLPVERAVGCSGGSLYAAAAALGYDDARAEALTRSFWTPTLMQGYAANLKAVHERRRGFGARDGLVDGDAIDASLTGTFGESTFADARVPLAIVATDLETGVPVVLRDGLVRDAVRASVAIPVVFPPKELGGRLLVDGAIADPLPVDVAIRDGAGTIVAMAFDLPYRARLKSLAAVQEQVTAITTNHLLRARFAFQTLAHHGEVVPIVPTFDRTVSMFDPSTIPYLIERGEAAARANLPFLEAALGG
jgi:NTE family protein